MKTSASEPTGVKSQIVDEVLGIWNKASIPTVTKSRIPKVFESCLNDIINLRKFNVTENKMQRYETKHNAILEKCTSLFDIAACKCIKKSSFGRKGEKNGNRWS